MFFYFLFFFKKLLLFPVFRVLTFLKPFPKTQTQTKPNETNQRIHHVLSIYHTFVHSFVLVLLLGFLFSRSLHLFSKTKQTIKHHHVLLLLLFFFFSFPYQPTNQPTVPPCSAIIAKETGKAGRLLPSPFKTAK